MQPVPEDYELLDFVGFTDRGIWSNAETYIKNDIVHKDNALWRCLQDNTVGIIPTEGEYWTIFIASENDSSGITTTDTQGLVGEKGEKVSNQLLIDAIADQVINRLITKSMMSGTQINDANKVPTSALAYAMQQKINELNEKLPTRYAGSNSAGGSANSAVKLDSSSGGATQPVYFSGGKPVACTHTLGKSVPANAVFTDTWRDVVNNLTSTDASKSLSAAQGKVLNDKISQLTTVTTGNANINANYLATGSSCSWIKVGRICHVEGVIIPKIALVDNGVLFTGVPRAVGGGGQSFDYVSEKSNSTGRNGFLKVIGTEIRENYYFKPDIGATSKFGFTYITA